MRIIKFKIWNKKKNKWHFKEPIHLFGEVIIMGEILNANLEDKPMSLEELNDLVPLQFTGFKDKNGKDIYDSDYIDWAGEHRLLVVWSDYGWRAVDDNRVVGENLAQIRQYSEVIGNIYENPELLGDTK